MINAVLPSALNLLLATCTAIAVIALLRPLTQRLCGAVAVLRLWWILPVALLATAIPKYAAPVEESAVGYIEFTSNAEPAAIVTAAPLPVTSRSLPWKAIVFAVWLSGALLTAAWMARAQFRFLRSVQWRTRRRGTLPVDAGPAVVGAFRPRLALPADFATRYSPAERRLILLHEFIHLYRRDGLANLAMSALLVMQWFNPLLHWASRAMSRDQEGACDAAVAMRHPNALRTYADALLKTQPDMQHLPLVCRWHAYHPTVERIAMLKIHRNARTHSKRAAVLLVAGAALAGALAYAAKPPAPPVAPPVPPLPSITEAPVAAAEAPPIIASPSTPTVPPAPTVQPGENRAPMPPTLRRQPTVPATPFSTTPPTPQPTPPPPAPVRLHVTAPTAPTAPTPPIAATTPTPPSVPQPLAYVPGAAPNAEESERITLRFNSTDLAAFIKVVADFSGRKFDGTESLRGIRITIAKRDVPYIAATRVVLACNGFAMQQSGDRFVIERSTELPVQPDPDACIADGIPNGANGNKSSDPDRESAAMAKSRTTVRFSDIGLQSFVRIVLSSKGLKLEGVEQLPGTKFSVAKKNANVLELLTVALGCHGYSLNKTDNGYSIEKTGLSPQADPTACVEAGVANGPESTPKVLAGKVYKINLVLTRDGKIIASPAVVTEAGSTASMMFGVSGDKDFLKFQLIANPAAEGVGLDLNIFEGTDRTIIAKPRLVSPLGMKQSVEFRTPEGNSYRLEAVITENPAQASAS